jgi:RNA polymerase sigma-70 factor (ECF subfamily)
MAVNRQIIVSARPRSVSSAERMAPSDEELVEAFQRGDRSAFDTLIQRWDRKIQGAIYRVMGSDEEARDLCQEAFLRAFRGLGTFKREARFSSWLYQIALNVCRDRLRRRKGRTQVSLDELEGDPAVIVKGPTALDLVERGDLARAVALAMESLPPEQREVVILKEYQGLTFPEIADVLDVPVSTVKTRLYRGLDLLRHRLERQGVVGRTAVSAATS